MKKKHGKKYQDATKDIDLKKEYSLEGAVSLVKKTNIAKFDPTLEVHMKLGVDLSKPEQNVRSTVVLPHGTGKKLKILAFVDEKQEKEAKDADFVGLDEFVEKINKGWLGFDVAIATPETMPKIAKLAKTLGARGMMPNPKAGTVTKEIGKVVGEFRKGKVEFRTDSLGGIHVSIGKLSFDDKKLIENFTKLYRAILAARPSTIKGDYIKSISLSSTMGAGIKVDLTSLK